MSDYKDTVAFTKAKIDAIREQIRNLRNNINAHVGEGGDLHPIASSTTSGFMSDTQLTDITTTIPTLYSEALVAVVNSNIPSGTTCWYYGDPEDIPLGWHLTSADSSNSLYKITTVSGGGGLRGVNTNSEVPGTVETNTGKNSTRNVSTIALYSIRKD